MMWIPTFIANLDCNLFGLDNKFLEVFQLYSDATPVALRDRFFTCGKPIGHD